MRLSRAMDDTQKAFVAAVKRELEGKRVWVKVGRSEFIADICAGEDQRVWRTRIRAVNACTLKRREFDVDDIIRKYEDGAADTGAADTVEVGEQPTTTASAPCCTECMRYSEKKGYRYCPICGHKYQ